MKIHLDSDLPIIDCRSEQAFQQGHIRGATSLPAAQLAARMHELPKTSVSLIVCGDAGSLSQANNFLISKGYQVSKQLLWNSALEAELLQTRQLVRGMESRRLWQPAPLIERFVQELMPQYAIQPGIGVDVACGAGRDLVYLAMHGWQMTGIDYRVDGLQRAQQLAVSQNVNVTTLERDLENGEDPFPEWADASVDLICVARYLHRPLFPYLKRILKSGGVLIYQTFMQGAERFGSPRNPNFLLKPGELAALFAEAEILLDEVETLEDGRPLSAFIGRLR